ncbi:MAG: tetratricopeptide repeat protein, partial [Planctomycetes bacterium]|nr:tetratricopeptide repeat protein [Planctomycetota bacterium]
HPIHTESVAWIAGRTDVLATLFSLLACLFFLRKASAAGDAGLSVSARSCAFFGLALLSKEVSAALVILLPLYDLLFVSRLDLARFGRNVARVHVFYAAVAVAYFGLRLWAVGSLGATSANPAFPSDAALKAIAVMRVLLSYAKPLLLPVSLNAEFEPVLPSNATEVAALASLGLFGALLVAVIGLARRAPRVSFSLAWMLAALLPTSGIVPIAEIAAERFAYLPSVGFACLVALGGWQLRRSTSMGAGLLAALLLAYSALAVQRNFDWQSELSLFKATAVTAPGCARTHMGLGVVYSEGPWPMSRAIRECRKAVNAKPDLPDAHNNLGNVLMAAGVHEAALKEFQTAISLGLPLPTAHNNLGLAYLRLNKPSAAVAEFEKALKLDPNYADAHWGLGSAHYLAGLLDSAILGFQAAIRLDPDHADAFNNLGACYLAKGHVHNGIAAFERALVINPNQLDAHINLGDAFTRLGQHDAAVAWYSHALAINYSLPEVHLRLAQALLNCGKPREAAAFLADALRLDPNNTRLRELLNRLG